jgi:hypothetical protein
MSAGNFSPLRAQRKELNHSVTEDTEKSTEEEKK